jgi:4-hydroxy-tetrahydrodipicolinate synthase
MSNQPLRGVFAPVLTPFKADLSPDVEKWIDFCRQLLDDGCHGLCPFGTTSEANSLGIDERMEMLERLVDAGIDASILMPGTGMCAIPDTVKLTKHAVDLGCAAVLTLPPFYYKGVSDDGLFRSIAEVVERVGDARLRMYLYHIPPIAQVGFPLAVLERLFAAYPHTVVGMKDSSGDWNNIHATLTALPEFETFPGSEKFLLQAMRLGGAGTISAMANVIPGHLRRLYDGWLSEDAETLQAEANVVRDHFRAYAPIPAIKAVIGERAGDPAWRTVRPPLVAMSDADAAPLLTAMGITRGVAAD